MTNKVYITPEGARALREELQYIWKVKRPEVTKKVSAAAALGDRSENADYIYGKKHLREIDSRVRFLLKRMDNLEIVDRKPDDQNKVFFGAWVKVEDDDGNLKSLRIVGVDELDITKGWISLYSPMAKGLLGKQKEDEISIKSPEGQTNYYITDVSYNEWSDT